MFFFWGVEFSDFSSHLGDVGKVFVDAGVADIGDLVEGFEAVHHPLTDDLTGDLVFVFFFQKFGQFV